MPRRSFSAFSNVLELDVSFNRLTILQPESMYDTTPNHTIALDATIAYVLALRFNNNEITAVTRDALVPFLGLRALDLSYNYISSLPAGAFAGCTHLKDLFLSVQ